MLGVFVAAAGLAVSVAVLRRVALYRRMFSEAHFREVYERFGKAIRTVSERWDAPGSPAGAAPLAQDAFVTSARLAIAVTASLAGRRHVLHVSMSQTSGYTTSAAANRFGFFLVTMLNQNKLELDPFVTLSRIHHLVFTSDTSGLRVADFAAVDEHYRRAYRPLPYVSR